MEKKIIVEGMMCKHCAKHVEEACKKVNGVREAKVNLEDKSVLVSGDNYSLDEIKKNIIDAGYEPKF